MANTAYESLADRLFARIKDYDFAAMSEDLAYEIVIGYIDIACAKFESCNQDLEDRDDDLQEFNFELSINNIQILVNYMIVEWLDSNFILTGTALKARMTSNDFKSLGQKDMLAKAIELRDVLLKETDQLAINRSYRKDSMLFDLITKRGR